MTEVLRTWLRFDDVYCGRCGKWCGPEGDTVYVVEAMVCVDCVTADEVSRVSA